MNELIVQMKKFVGVRQLTPEEIEEVIGWVGSYALIGLATRSFRTAGLSTPVGWALGASTPPCEQMKRLVVIRKTMATVIRRHGHETAREWFQRGSVGGGFTPVEAIRDGHFVRTYRSARSTMRLDVYS